MLNSTISSAHFILPIIQKSIDSSFYWIDYNWNLSTSLPIGSFTADRLAGMITRLGLLYGGHWASADTIKQRPALIRVSLF